MPKYVVRYGAMRHLGIFSVRGSHTMNRGAKVVARTSRGLEAGDVLCEATAEAVEQIKNPDNGQILRQMTTDDLNELAHIDLNSHDEFQTCQRYIEKLGLDMELVDVEHIFGGERIVVFYLADERVDFRELVKQLAVEFRTRIEMRQIGVRDEARLMADYGDCGKPVCCNTHLSAMPPVSMKMAKMQKATLDPTKISGRCGRLKCCLRYEYDTYVDMQKELPPVGSDIVTQNGRAHVLNQSILASQLLVSMEDGRRVLINADEVLTVIRRGGGNSGRKRSSGRQSKGEKKSDGGAKPGNSSRNNG